MPNRRLFFFTPFFVASLLLAQPPQTPTIKVTTEEVVLDVVVRDKKGKGIKDLGAADFTVTDNGAKQKINSFRLVEGKEAISQGAKVALDPLRQIRLVTLVFERLGTEPRRMARQAALDLIKGEQAQNVFYSVVAIDQKLWPLQNFTADKDALRKAVELATSGQYAQYSVEADRIKDNLRKQLQTPAAPASTDQSYSAIGTQEVERRLAQTMSDMLAFDASVSLAESTRLSIFALLSLARGQFQMPGRKTILYFSEGMWLPPHLDEPFRSLISTSNRGNIAFYAIDTRGVMSWSQNQSTANEVLAAAKETAADITRDDGRVSQSALTASDRAENAMRNNTQLALRNLSDDTGGFLIGDSNDLRVPLRNVSEEINSYYEITYSPGIEKYDGSFRKTDVNVARKDLVVHHRTGYFALPASVVTSRGPAVLPYEMPLLNALTMNPFPKDVEFRSAALRMQPQASGQKGSVIVEVPMSGITFTEEKAKGTYKARLSLIALLKDEKGEIVQKLTRDLPLQGAVQQIPQVKAGNFIYKEQVVIPAGRYTLETAVIDYETSKVGARKAAFVVPPFQPGVHISSLCLVRSYQSNVKDLDPNDPFQFQGGRITPSLGGTVYAVKGAMLSVFMTIYPDPAIPDKPTLTIEYLVDGQVVGKGEVPLPAADDQGRIPYVMSSAAESLPPGNYQIRAIVRQGATTAEERTLITVATR